MHDIDSGLTQDSLFPVFRGGHVLSSNANFCRGEANVAFRAGIQDRNPSISLSSYISYVYEATWPTYSTSTWPHDRTKMFFVKRRPLAN